MIEDVYKFVTLNIHMNNSDALSVVVQIYRVKLEHIDMTMLLLFTDWVLNQNLLHPIHYMLTNSPLLVWK